jgi:TPP-dependent pyruvate/acetoin dehydrogenase alpha subunit
MKEETHGLSAEAIGALYKSVARIRRVEEEVARLYPTDLIKSPIHLSIGQEAVSVGVCDVLERHDIVYGTYRGHALYLAKGGDLKAMIAELYGRETGCAGGKAGSMHLVDPAANVMGMSAVVATNIPLAVGHAFALKSQNAAAVVVCFFGEGATDEGVFHEAMNFAALKALPILFVCENNRLAIHSPITTRMAGPGLAARFGAYGIPGQSVDDENIFSMRQAAEYLTGAVRAGGGPHYLECRTSRWREHVGPTEDWDAGYRDAAEEKARFDKDPVRLLGAMLAVDARAAIDRDVEAEIGEAFSLADAAPYPSDGALMDHVFG